MKERLLSALADLWENHRGRTVGAILGLLFAMLVLTIGFFPTVFLVLCSGLGYILGGRLENGQGDGFLMFLRDRLPERIQYWHTKHF